MTEPITLNLTLKELQQIDKYVEINDDTLSVIMKITNAYPQQKSPVEIAYKDWWGEYPGTEIWTKDDEMRWVSFTAGYNASQEPEKEQKWGDVVRESVKWCEEHRGESVEDYLTPQGPQGPVGPGPGPKGVIVGYEPTPQTPDKIEENLREAFQKVQQTEEWKETQRKIDSNYDDMVKNPPEFLKFELGQSLTDLIYDWWEDIFTKNSNDDTENCIGRLVYWIEEWLPKSQSSSGSQNVDTELLVDGFNDCLTKIKSKLRNKK